MSGARAGSGWWDQSADGGDDDDAHPGSDVEQPIDTRMTQPMPRIERDDDGDHAGSPVIPWSGSHDTVRVDIPAWFLRAQQAAAAQGGEPDDDDAGVDDADDADLDERRPSEAHDGTEGDPPDDDVAVTPIEPNEVVHDLDAAYADAAVPPTPAASASTSAASRITFLDPTVARSYAEPTPPPDLAAGVVGLVGAALLAVGSFLTWGESTGVIVATVNGLSGSNGWGTLVAGMVVALGSGLVLTGRRSAIVGGAMLLAALAAVFFCGFSAVDIGSTGDELPQILNGAGVDLASANESTLELTSGFAVVALGAAASLVAGTIAFARRI